MRRLLLLMGVVVLGIAGYRNFAGGWEITNHPPKNDTIVAFGDSLVKGVGSTPGNDFVSVLSARLGRPIANLGVSGNTTEDAIKRLPAVAEQNAGTVLVLLGGNDYLRRAPKAVTIANLHTIITQLQENGSMVVLLGVRGGLLRDNYEKEFRDLAKLTGAAYVPNVLDGIIGTPSVMADQIHPNDAGYAIIAEKVARVVEDLVGY